jgi:hypothetical protein
VRYVPGRIDEMAPHTFETLRRMAEVLGQPPITEDVLEDPLVTPPLSQEPTKAEARKPRAAKEGTIA